jgi:RNA polymerase II subunit A-like phosphatase
VFSFSQASTLILTRNITFSLQPGTAKVIKAKQRKNVKIVRPEWLYHSIGKWQRQDESQYLLLEAPGKSTPVSATPSQAADEDETGAEEEDQGGISEGMDENHRPMSINKEEINEHLKAVNWDDMGKEVEDFVGDLDDTDFDSDTRLATLCLPFHLTLHCRVFPIAALFWLLWH